MRLSHALGLVAGGGCELLLAPRLVLGPRDRWSAPPRPPPPTIPNPHSSTGTRLAQRTGHVPRRARWLQRVLGDRVGVLVVELDGETDVAAAVAGEEGRGTSRCRLARPTPALHAPWRASTFGGRTSAVSSTSCPSLAAPGVSRRGGRPHLPTSDAIALTAGTELVGHRDALRGCRVETGDQMIDPGRARCSSRASPCRISSRPCRETAR